MTEHSQEERENIIFPFSAILLLLFFSSYFRHLTLPLPSRWYTWFHCMQLAVRVCGPESVEVAAYARCLAQMSEDYSQFLSPGLPRPFYMPNPVPLYRQTLAIIEKVMGPEDQSVSRVLLLRFRILPCRQPDRTGTRLARLPMYKFMFLC